jgi:hypothetical protein
MVRPYDNLVMSLLSPIAVMKSVSVCGQMKN